MNGFLSTLSLSSRERAKGMARRLELSEGEPLLEHGRQSGDVYWIEQGRLEVRDPRSRPTVVLEALGAGEIVGELSFVESGSRSADVIAVAATTVLHWRRADLLAAMAEDSTFASEWWRAIAVAVARRVRSTSQQAAATPAVGESEGALVTAALAEARRCRDVLAEADARLREAADDKDPFESVHAALEAFLEGFDGLSGQAEDRAELAAISARLRRELDPFWLRALSAQLSRSPDLNGSTHALLDAHLAHGVPRGDDALGEAIDAWLLASPYAVGVRGRDAALRSYVLTASDEDPLRVTLLGGGTGSIAATLLMLGGGRQATVTCVEASGEALAFFDAGLSGRPPGVELQLMGASRLSTLTGESLAELCPQRLIVADNWMDTVPSSMLVRFAEALRGRLSPSGALLLGGHRPAGDACFWDHLMGHPTLRWKPEDAATTLAVAGFCAVRSLEIEGSGLLLVASTESDTG